MFPTHHAMRLRDGWGTRPWTGIVQAMHPANQREIDVSHPSRAWMGHPAFNFDLRLILRQMVEIIGNVAGRIFVNGMRGLRK